ncbi:hypothetical protein [Acinetobacter nosocomialis]|uniref:hypothetical protein n=1 Tax=Acinetobacter nosocomialis TaxID=106654 RepID=UPI0026F2E7EE|nr:hypothetical protein [Acinetobacter nosocomialis]MDO7219203.1 hypothetical protein [Acinetobacter nosocomialis]
MKKVILFIISVLFTIFSSIAMAEESTQTKISPPNIQEVKTQNADISSSTAQLFQTQEESNIHHQGSFKNVKVMSVDDLKDTKGGVTGPFVCIECGGRHGGVYSSSYCQYCYIKLQ